MKSGDWQSMGFLVSSHITSALRSAWREDEGGLAKAKEKEQKTRLQLKFKLELSARLGAVSGRAFRVL